MNVPRVLLTLAVAAAFFWLGFDGGTYGLASRAPLAIAVWWAIVVTVVLGLWPLARPPVASLVAGAFLAGLCAYTALSLLWAESAERAFTEANRVALLTGVFGLAVLAGTRGTLGRWLDGLALGIAAVGVLALASRLFPETLPSGNVPEFLPAAVARLSWPVEYWNGLAILLALSLPFLLRVAVGAPLALWRGLAVGVVPALAAAMFLTSSRGGFATAFVALAAFLVLVPRRWAAGTAIAVAAAGSAAAIAVLLDRPELVNRPFESPLAAGQGRSAAPLILLVCAVTGLVYGVGSRLLAGVRPPRLAGWAAAALLVAAAVVGVAAASPVERFEEFREPPAELEADDFVTAHLLSGSGSGRWQFWAAALDQWETRPLTGRGAGSYEAWWAQHGSFAHFLRDAHSLYLETLGELGVVGLLLLASALATGLVAGGRRLLAAGEPEERIPLAALLAAFVAYLVAAGIDWMWELTVVSVVGLTLLGLLTGPASATRRPGARPARRAGGRRGRLALGAATLAIGWLVIAAQAIPFLAQTELASSQEAVRAGDLSAAREHAEGARDLQPWAASPHLQLALVHEGAGDYAEASAAIRRAIERDPEDWRLWLVAARVEVKAGDVAEARRSLARARELNPRSPLFATSPE